MGAAPWSRLEQSGYSTKSTLPDDDSAFRSLTSALSRIEPSECLLILARTKLKRHYRVTLPVSSHLVNDQLDRHAEGLLRIFFQVLGINID
jgi:hypothetical protein